jgi:hypothetical protein
MRILITVPSVVIAPRQPRLNGFYKMPSPPDHSLERTTTSEE